MLAYLILNNLIAILKRKISSVFKFKVNKWLIVIFFYTFISRIFHFYKTQPYDTAKSKKMPGLPHFKIFNLGKLPYHILKFLARKLKIMDFFWGGVGGSGGLGRGYDKNLFIGWTFRLFLPLIRVIVWHVWLLWPHLSGRRHLHGIFWSAVALCAHGKMPPVTIYWKEGGQQ